MIRPSFDAIPFASPEDCHEAGMFAARWIADPPADVTPERLARATEYRDAALNRWAAYFPPGTPDPTNPPPERPISQRRLACGGHAWSFTDAPDAVQYHAAGCPNTLTCGDAAKA